MVNSSVIHNTSASDCLERLVPEMTYYVSTDNIAFLINKDFSSICFHYYNSISLFCIGTCDQTVKEVSVTATSWLHG